MPSVTWSAAPASAPDQKEYFTSEDHAVDVAFDWSVDLGGRPIIIYCNGAEWMEIVA